MRGFYSVAAGMFTQQEQLNTISNNIANANTAGFKAQDNISSSFGKHVQLRMSNQNEHVTKEKIGKGAFMTVNIDEYTDYTQGPITPTERDLDLAINGPGFFVAETKDGIVLTRNGQLELDQDGLVRIKDIGYLLNDSLDQITLEGSDFTVSSNGEILQNGESIDAIAMVYPNEDVILKKIGEETYTTGDNQEDFTQMEEGTFQIVQGAVEASNVDMTEELTRMIRTQRNFQSCAEILKIYDAINEISVNQIGKL